jgi:hypothetical protein
LVEIEYGNRGYLSAETVAVLQEEIQRTGLEMRRLGMLNGEGPEVHDAPDMRDDRGGRFTLATQTSQHTSG